MGKKKKEKKGRRRQMGMQSVHVGQTKATAIIGVDGWVSGRACTSACHGLLNSLIYSSFFLNKEREGEVGRD